MYSPPQSRQSRPLCNYIYQFSTSWDLDHLLTLIIVSDGNHKISVEAADHGKPIKSATAIIHIILNPAQPPQPPPAPVLQPELPRSIPTSNNNNNRPRIDSIEKEFVEEDGEERALSKMFVKDTYTVQVFENAETPLVLLSLGRELVTGIDGVNFR